MALAAGLKTLERVAGEGFFARLEAKTRYLVDGLLASARQHGIPMAANRVGGMFGLFFTDKAEVLSFADVMASDADRFRLFFHGMLDEGIYLAPSAYEAGFVSIAHEQDHLDATIEAADRVLERIVTG